MGSDMLDILFMIAGVLIIIFIWIMLYDGNRFVISRHNISDARIAQHYRTVVIADLHNKRYGKNNELLIEAVRSLNPDCIMVAGDIPVARPGAKLDVALELIGALSKEYKICYANGNHEHRLELYRNKYGDMADRYEAGLKSCGVDRLVNSHEFMNEKNIAVYGSQIDRKYYKRFKKQHMDEDYLNSILGKPDKSRYNILIAHNPDYFPEYSKWGADLVLSGHVHGGMIRIPFIGKGVISPNCRLFPEYDGGVFKDGSSTMILSRGLGMHTIPIRIFNPGELIVIDFEPE
jgi:predicted MPP superfamily phosphohydrolase